MSKRFKIGRKLYCLDSSGPAPDGERLKRQADMAFDEVKQYFDPSKLRPLGSGGQKPKE